MVIMIINQLPVVHQQLVKCIFLTSHRVRIDTKLFVGGARIKIQKMLGFIGIIHLVRLKRRAFKSAVLLLDKGTGATWGKAC